MDRYGQQHVSLHSCSSILALMPMNKSATKTKVYRLIRWWIDTCAVMVRWLSRPQGAPSGVCTGHTKPHASGSSCRASVVRISMKNDPRWIALHHRHFVSTSFTLNVYIKRYFKLKAFIQKFNFNGVIHFNDRISINRPTKFGLVVVSTHRSALGPRGGLRPVPLIWFIRKACDPALGTLIRWWWRWWV
jgi:hypothetical protein